MVNAAQQGIAPSPRSRSGPSTLFDALKPSMLAIATVAGLLGAEASALAQAGSSEGGSIGGNIGGSTGGSIGGNIGAAPKAQPAGRPVVRPAARAPVTRKPVAVQRQQRFTRYEPVVRRSRAGEYGGGGSFDGVWSISTASNCAGTGSGSFRVSGGRLSGRNAAHGSVSSSGALYSSDHFGGMTNVYSGRLAGNSGGGSFQRNDGCTGQWSAAR